MTIRGVIFDLGNTLMYFDGAWEDVIQQGAADLAAFFERKRIKLDGAGLAEAFIAERKAGREVAYRTQQEVVCGESLRCALDKLAAPQQAYPLLAEAVRAYFRREEATWKAYPDAKPTLKRLFEQGYRLGLLSNATDDLFIQRLVNQLELRPWLSPVFSSAGMPFRKPRPEPFNFILTRWNLPPEAVVVVGDALEYDILGAHNAGMRGVLITADELPINEPHRGRIIPDVAIQSLAELPALLEGWS